MRDVARQQASPWKSILQLEINRISTHHIAARVTGNPICNVIDLRASNDPLSLGIFAMLLDLCQANPVDSRSFSVCHILTRKGSYQSKCENSTCREVCARSGTLPAMMLLLLLLLLLLERVHG